MEARNGLGRVIEGYRSAVRSLPDNVSARRRLAEAYELRGDVEGALAEWRRVTLLEPSDAYACSRLAELLSWKRDFDASANWWLEATRLAPESAEFRHGLSVALRKRGACAVAEQSAA